MDGQYITLRFRFRNRKLLCTVVRKSDGGTVLLPQFRFQKETPHSSMLCTPFAYHISALVLDNAVYSNSLSVLAGRLYGDPTPYPRNQVIAFREKQNLGFARTVLYQKLIDQCAFGHLHLGFQLVIQNPSFIEPLDIDQH